MARSIFTAGLKTGGASSKRMRSARFIIRLLLVVVPVLTPASDFVRYAGNIAGGLKIRCVAGFAGEMSEGERNYFVLRQGYTKWHEGLFGSRRYYERKLIRLLYGMIGKEITTGHDYMLASPEGVFDKTVTCNLQNCRWLYIHGALDAESVKNIVGSDGSVLRRWWRSGMLVAVTGRLKRYKLDWDAGGDIVHIYLDTVRLLK